MRKSLVGAALVAVTITQSAQHACLAGDALSVLVRDTSLVGEDYIINDDHPEARRIYAAVRRAAPDWIASSFADGSCGICLYATQKVYLIEFASNEKTRGGDPDEFVIFETEAVLVLSKRSERTELTSKWHLARIPKVFLGANVPFGTCSTFLPLRYSRSDVERDDLGPDVETREE